MQELFDAVDAAYEFRPISFILSTSSRKKYKENPNYLLDDCYCSCHYNTAYMFHFSEKDSMITRVCPTATNIITYETYKLEKLLDVLDRFFAEAKSKVKYKGLERRVEALEMRMEKEK